MEQAVKYAEFIYFPDLPWCESNWLSLRTVSTVYDTFTLCLNEHKNPGLNTQISVGLTV